MIEIPGKGVAVIPLFDPDYWNPDSRHKIIRPDAHKDRCDNGVVKYLGKRTSGDIRVGDHVIFPGYTGKLMVINKEMLIVMPENFIDAKIIGTANTEIPGLYFRDNQGDYHACNYEIALEFIAQGIAEADWYKGVNIKPLRPKKEDYDKMQLSWSE